MHVHHVIAISQHITTYHGVSCHIIASAHHCDTIIIAVLEFGWSTLTCLPAELTQFDIAASVWHVLFGSRLCRLPVWPCAQHLPTVEDRHLQKWGREQKFIVRVFPSFKPESCIEHDEKWYANDPGCFSTCIGCAMWRCRLSRISIAVQQWLGSTCHGRLDREPTSIWSGDPPWEWN